jgi:hypothetical protein
MAQISRDIKVPASIMGKDYLGFIQNRLEKEEETFRKKIYSADIETKYSGLYSLLRLSQDTSNEEIESAIDKYIEFIKLPYDPTDEEHVRNEGFFVKVFIALKNSDDP